MRGLCGARPRNPMISDEVGIHRGLIGLCAESNASLATQSKHDQNSKEAFGLASQRQARASVCSHARRGHDSSRLKLLPLARPSRPATSPNCSADALETFGSVQSSISYNRSILCRLAGFALLGTKPRPFHPRFQHGHLEMPFTDLNKQH